MPNDAWKKMFDDAMREQIARQRRPKGAPGAEPPFTFDIKIVDAEPVNGIYEGTDPTLLGKRALLMPGPPGKVKAQFDDLSLAQSHGWHEFNLTDFNDVQYKVRTTNAQ